MRQDMDAYSLPLTRALILQKSLSVCAKYGVMHNKLHSSSPTEFLPIEELEHWLAQGEYLTPAAIRRQGDQGLGAMIAKRFLMQIAIQDTSLSTVIDYWLDLTRVRHRPFRSATTVILFSTIHEALKLINSSELEEAMPEILPLIDYVWVTGLQRACMDVDIYLRAYSLKMTTLCCKASPDVFWNTNTAKLILKGACDTAKTVRNVALRQMVELASEPGLGFDSIEVSQTWIDVLALYADKQSRQSFESRYLALAGLTALFRHSGDALVNQKIGRNLLIKYIQNKERISTIATTIGLLWHNPRDSMMFNEIMDIFTVYGGNYLSNLGEALGVGHSEPSVKLFELYIEAKRGDDMDVCWLRVLSGLAKTLSDDQVLKLIDALCPLCSGNTVTITTYFVLKLMRLVKNRNQDGFLQALQFFERSELPHLHDLS